MRITKQRAAENRQRVVDEAARLFRERGFDGVGVAELMAAAGLTHGGFYNHFESKDEVEAAAETVAGAELPPASEDDLWPAGAAEAPPAEPPAPAARKPVGLLIGATVAILVLLGVVIALANRGGGSKAPPVQAAAPPVQPAAPPAVTPQKAGTPPVAAPPATVAPSVSDEAQSSLEVAAAAPKPVKHRKVQPKIDIPF